LTQVKRVRAAASRDGEPARLVSTGLARARRPQADRIVLNAGRAVADPLPDYAELDAVM
jgi:hypothetical protein